MIKVTAKELHEDRQFLNNQLIQEGFASVMGQVAVIVHNFTCLGI